MNKTNIESYIIPSLELLRSNCTSEIISDEDVNEISREIVSALNFFGIEIVKVKVEKGVFVSLYELIPADGVRISKIEPISADIIKRIAKHVIRIIATIQTLLVFKVHI